MHQSIPSLRGTFSRKQERTRGPTSTCSWRQLWWSITAARTTRWPSSKSSINFVRLYRTFITTGYSTWVWGSLEVTLTTSWPTWTTCLISTRTTTPGSCLREYWPRALWVQATVSKSGTSSSSLSRTSGTWPRWSRWRRAGPRCWRTAAWAWASPRCRWWTGTDSWRCCPWAPRSSGASGTGPSPARAWSPGVRVAASRAGSRSKVRRMPASPQPPMVTALVRATRAAQTRILWGRITLRWFPSNPRSTGGRESSCCQEAPSPRPPPQVISWSSCRPLPVSRGRTWSWTDWWRHSPRSGSRTRWGAPETPANPPSYLTSPSQSIGWWMTGRLSLMEI